MINLLAFGLINKNLFWETVVTYGIQVKLVNLLEGY